MAMRVVLQTRNYGEVILNNITEIHYNYHSSRGRLDSVRIAFESDIDCTGRTWDVNDILEFEAKEV